MDRKLHTALTLVLAASLSLPAGAVPDTLVHQGRLLDNAGDPLLGVHQLTFTIYDQAEDGTASWTETITAQLDAGTYSVTLGEGAGLTALLASGGPYFLGLAVDGGTEFRPRQEIASVPFALRAGTLTPGAALDISALSLDGQALITSPSHVLGGLTCTEGQVPKHNGDTWACGEDVDTTIPDTDTDTLAALVGCAEGQVVKWDGDAWACGEDVDTTIPDTDTLAELVGCGEGQVVKWDGDAWACADDAGVLVEDDPVYRNDPASGIQSSDIASWDTAYGWGNHAAAGYLWVDDPPTSCVDGDQVVWNETETSWQCQKPAGETDPVFGASAAAGIDGQDIAGWNTAYGWGNHAAAGYLTAYSEVDPQVGALTTDAWCRGDGAAVQCDVTAVTDNSQLANGAGYITAAGNAATATALAANPADCPANQVARSIAASGDLTCSALTDADVPDGITLSGYVPLAGGVNVTGGLNLATSAGKVGVGLTNPAGAFEVHQAATCSPAQTLDQAQNDLGSGNFAGNSVWQSFTAGVTADLVAIEVYVSAMWASTLNIYQGEGTGGALLSSVAVPEGGSGWIRYTLTHAVSQTAGAQYTFEFLSGGLMNNLRVSSTNPYGGGRCNLAAFDLAFRTYTGRIGVPAVFSVAAGGTCNVGIGTTTPNDALDVVGDIDATGCVQTGDANTIGGICFSDARLKEEVRPLAGSLDRVAQLNPVTFAWREGAPEHGRSTGLLAQEVEAIFPELVSTGSDGYKRVRYDLELEMHLLAAIRELNERNVRLAVQQEELTAQLRQLAAAVDSARRYGEEQRALREALEARLDRPSR